MIKLIGLIVSIFLIGLIFVRYSKESIGLAGFTIKSNFLSSSNSTERFLDFLTAFGIMIYVGTAIALNL